MGFVRKYKTEIIVSLSSIALYLFLRLPTLLQLPIFTDEAIYIRWAQIAKDDANWRFISLTDGKQPLFIWAVMIAMRFFSDPLVAGRIVSAGAGLLTMVGLFFLGREVFNNRWVGILSASLYALFPFALVYDRMALYDSLVGTFAVWALYSTFLLVRTLRLDRALMMGFITGAAVLNKTSGFFTIYLLPFTFLLFDFKAKNLNKRILKFVGLMAVVIIMTYGFYAILRLSPFFYIIEEKNAVFVYPLQEWIKHPFTYFFSNFSAQLDWYLRYVGLPMTVGSILAFAFSREYLREKLLLFLWFCFPFIGLALTGKTLYPRYIFFMTLSLLPLASYTLIKLSQTISKEKWGLVCVLTLSYWVVADVLIISNFIASPVPQADKAQYLASWPAGVGVKEATAFFRRESEDKKIFIGTQGTFGLMPYAFEIEFHRNPNVTVKGFWPIYTDPPEELLQAAAKQDTYVVFYQHCPSCGATGIAPKTWPLTQIMQFERPDKASYVTVYKVRPQ